MQKRVTTVPVPFHLIPRVHGDSDVQHATRLSNVLRCLECVAQVEGFSRLVSLFTCAELSPWNNLVKIYGVQRQTRCAYIAKDSRVYQSMVGKKGKKRDNLFARAFHAVKGVFLFIKEIKY